MLSSPMILSLIVTLISLGAGIMGLSIIKTRKILRFFKTESDKLNWRVMFSLMVFFLGGYLLCIYLTINKLFDWIPLLTGMVFFFGSLFVLFSVNTYYQTLQRLFLVQEQYRIAKDNAESALSQLTETQQSQMQLIQRETMLALGKMVAGVAHEINNPISFIYGNLQYLRQYTNDLLNLLDTYAAVYPNPDDKIAKALAKSDISFIHLDLPKLLDSMESGTTRISEIVESLSSFSRLNESEYKKADIHQGIDSTLVILQHRLNRFASNSKPISIIKDYGTIPQIYCNPRLLNQVFLNLINNAIDALIEKEVTPDSNLDEAATIWIRTFQSQENQVTISVTDNGCGMNEQICQSIFKPFFTTKAVGRGTGLGLSICHQIIVEQHGGSIKCVSLINKGTTIDIILPIKR
ncbi:HAMP domain-containing histidine kinase [Nostoc sp. FACHB-87]|uniref:sensor histidine kinase n=1 Tax=Nostocales TaxID=1161 RepID=UPI001685A4E6|nr:MULTISPECIES: ATP-binding protein [Nostocales]MBD2458933.1 HAMP domain-containing histidine kinase [Nostoc sp. FACHB-87]MBD2479935.1 HAMP domain-containing histidine kinase [Anabaena sp. FACHB-83]MBD2491775.1 HAMP domain-containing histidine kinase [Aulosira sp. FACHB-615]